MEARKIVIVSTKNQRKSVIMSSATTLAELKEDLRENGIDYDGMAFYEGTSKTELKTDESVLPHDVPYKGTTTNELVFMLTNTNKKIKSGAMSRAEAYAAIKANNLQAECVKKFGKNFTMCKTTDLIFLVEKAGKKDAPKAEKPSSVKEEKKEESKEQSGSVEVVDTKARAAIAKLSEILQDNGNIEEYEYDDIMSILGGEVKAASDNCTYSDSEINKMFDFVR